LGSKIAERNERRAYALGFYSSSGEAVIDCIQDPLPLMVKYLDGKDKMTNDEKEILLMALYIESRTRRGLAFEAMQELGRRQKK
jgi:hypothetical protein